MNFNIFRSNCRSSRPEVLCKKGVLKYFSKLTGKHLSQSLFFNKAVTLAQVFSCEFCEIFKNIFFTEHLLATASVFLGHCKVVWKKDRAKAPGRKK